MVDKISVVEKKKIKLAFLQEIALVTGGKNAGELVFHIVDKKNVNEFLIAKKLELTINQTRNVLYKLADEGLVSSVRKKDKKKGWYTYFWTFNDDKALGLFKKIVQRDIDNLEGQLKSRETKQYYCCKTCNSELTEDKALLQDFICPECGEVYELSDSGKPVKEINSAMNKLKLKLKVISEELAEIEEIKVKKLEREQKKIAKEKTEKRKASAKKSAKKRAANKKIADKKAGKKPKKKKKIVKKKQKGKIIKKKKVKKVVKKLVKKKKK